MAVAYTWHINHVNVYPTGSDKQEPVNTRNDVVHEITYTLEGSETYNNIQYRDSHTDTLYISTDNLSSFTSFDELNQETVQEWVKAELTNQVTSGNQSLIESLKSTIAESIEYNKNPPSIVKYIRQ
jgi:hypothetical protein